MLLLKKALPVIFVSRFYSLIHVARTKQTLLPVSNWINQKIVARLKAARRNWGARTFEGVWLKRPPNGVLRLHGYRLVHLEGGGLGILRWVSHTALSMELTAQPSLGSTGDHRVLTYPGSLKTNSVSKGNWGKSFLMRVMTQTGSE